MASKKPRKYLKYFSLIFLTVLALATSASWYHLDKIKNSSRVSFLVSSKSFVNQEPKTVLVKGKVKNSRSSFPKDLSSCISQGVSDLMILSEAIGLEENTKYYSVLLKLSDGKYRDSWVQDLLMVSGESCVSLSPGFEQPSSQRPGLISLSEFVPEQVARRLAFNRWRRILQQQWQGDREALKTNLEQASQPGPERVYLFKEDIWALKHLGIESSKIVVSESANISY